MSFYNSGDISSIRFDGCVQRVPSMLKTQKASINEIYMRKSRWLKNMVLIVKLNVRQLLVKCMCVMILLVIGLESPGLRVYKKLERIVE